MVFSYCNSCKISSTHVYSLVSSTLPISSTFLSLEINDTTNTICSTLRSSLINLCSLSKRPASDFQPHLWLHDTFQMYWFQSSRAKMVHWKILKTLYLRTHYLALCLFCYSITAAKKLFYKKKIKSTIYTSKQFFKFLLDPLPSPAPAANCTADTFALFFRKNL